MLNADMVINAINIHLGNVSINTHSNHKNNNIKTKTQTPTNPQHPHHLSSLNNQNPSNKNLNLSKPFAIKIQNSSSSNPKNYAIDLPWGNAILNARLSIILPQIT
jgi:hypothetical protein